MNRTRIVLWAFVAVLGLAHAGCKRGESGDGMDSDTLEISIPEDAAEQLEDTGRRIGHGVGQAMQSTGKAMQRAGERVEEEARPEAEPDTSGM